MFYIVVLILGILCGPYNSIVNVKALIGRDVKIISGDHSYLAVVALSFTNLTTSAARNVFCTGTLISRRHVLTSEHCFDESDDRPFGIVAGSNDVRRGLFYHPSWWLTYDQWCLNRQIRITEPDNDIALLKIFQDVPEHIVPMFRSQVSRNRSYFGITGTTLGWGTLDGNVFPNFLHGANLTIITNVECTNIIQRLTGRRLPVPGKFLCTQANPYILTMPGDSGNPFIIDNVLVAVTKGAAPILGSEYNPDKVNVHMTIQRYHNFIDTLMRLR